MNIQNPKIDRELLQDKVRSPLERPTEAAAPARDWSDTLTKLVRYFEEAEDTTAAARALSQRDRDYYDNDQWTQEELEILRKRRQPPLTINYIARKVETMRGYEKRQRSDPKAYPRTPKEAQTADAATDALRFVADQNDFDTVRSDVYENMLVEGAGAVDVVVEEMPDRTKKVAFKYVPWDRLFWDPHSRFRDFRDAAYKGVVVWMDRDQALARWGDNIAAEEAISETMRTGFTPTYEDRPANAWCDSKRTRVRVVQIHWQEDGEWMMATFTKGGFLDEPTVSPYKDKYGKPACSLIMRSMYVDRQNNRYGAVRGMISLQDEINKRRSKALHLLTVRQTYGNTSAIADVQKAKTELAKADGHVEIIGGSKFGEDFGVLPTGDLAQGQIALMEQAVKEMTAEGYNAALSGRGPQSQSGRAWEAQQQAGAITQEPQLDELRAWTRDVYEAAWTRVRQFWTDETWVRVTDDERNVKFVGLNRKVTLQDKLAEIEQQQGKEAAQAIAQQAGVTTPYDPKLREVVEVQNQVSDLDVDITIEDGPDVTTLQSEQFQQLADMAKSGLPIPPKALIQASSLRNKDQILDEMEQGGVPPELAKQMQEMQQQLQQAMQENQALKADKEADMAKIALEREKLQVENAPEGEPPSKQAETKLKMAQVDKTIAETIEKQIANAAAAAQLEALGIAPQVDEQGKPMPSQAERYAQQAFESVQALAEHIMTPSVIEYAEDGVTPVGIRKGNTFRPIAVGPDGQIQV